jgi:hypothetical protein
MSANAKKIATNPDFDLDAIAVDKKVKTATNIQNQIALEKAMLEGLKKAKQEPVKSLEDIDEIAPMKAEDLEYPDMDLPAPPEEDSELDLDAELANLDNELQALSEDDSEEIEEIEEIETAVDENDPTSGGFEISSEELDAPAEAAVEASAPETEDENQSGDESLEEINSLLAAGGLTKREEMRLKRLKKIAEKRKSRLEEEERLAQERQEQEERDRANNILSVEELMQQAKGGSGDSNSQDQHESVVRSSSSSTRSSIDLASVRSQLGQPKQGRVDNSAELLQHSAGRTTSTSSVVAGKQAAPTKERPWYMALVINILIILGEVVKGTLPAAIVWIYLHQKDELNLSQKAINHLASGEQFQIEVGLTLLKENADAQLREHYYKVVKNKIELAVAHVWNLETIDHKGMWEILSELYNYSFIDEGKLDLPNLVSSSMQKEEQSVRELYENFYQTELKNLSDPTLVDHLRQANIFMGQKECLKSYERFDLVLTRVPDSLAAMKGKHLSFHCAFLKDRKATRDYFKKKEAVTYLEKMRDLEEKRAPASTPKR